MNPLVSPGVVFASQSGWPGLWVAALFIALLAAGTVVGLYWDLGLCRMRRVRGQRHDGCARVVRFPSRWQRWHRRRGPPNRPSARWAGTAKTRRLAHAPAARRRREPS